MQRLGDGTWEVNLENTTLVDLSILKGAPISRLNLSNTTVAELTPLKGMPLVALNINATLVADLSALRGMPLTELRMLNPRKITDLSPLSDCKELQILTLPENAKNFELLRTLLKLERISFQDDPNNGYRPDMSTTEFWKEYAPESWQSRLRNSGLEIKTLKKLPDGTWEVNLDKSAVSDLTILIGAPISRLWLNSTAVSDLTPLRGMPLRKLAIFNTKVADLSPLEGMQLDYLNLTATKVADLSLLRGMPLVSLRLNDCLELTDLSPLEGATTLTQLSLPPNATNFEFLRAFPKLECLSFKGDPSNSYRPDKTAAEFWQEYDAKKN